MGCNASISTKQMSENLPQDQNPQIISWDCLGKAIVWNFNSVKSNNPELQYIKTFNTPLSKASQKYTP